MRSNFKENILLDMALFSEAINREIAVITANGTFLGKLIPENPDVDKYNDAIEFIKLHKKFNKEENTEVEENIVVLVDVTLLNSSNRTQSFPFVVIFVDQIIGVSYGRLANKED